jgi:hypothetical protein
MSGEDMLRSDIPEMAEISESVSEFRSELEPPCAIMRNGKCKSSEIWIKKIAAVIHQLHT